jgi:DNA polymerase III epsilon subunit-like protein
MNTTSIFDEAYISVDVETAGPSPTRYSLLSIGACSLSQPQKSFYVELQPVNDEMLSESFAIHGLSIEALRANGIPPLEAMIRFESWLQEVVPEDQVPIFVAFNAPFDWMFVSDYFHRYLGHNPFGHAALDIKAYYMGSAGSTWKETSMRNVSQDYLNGRRISHNAAEDALDQAIIFSRLYEEARNS